MFSKRKLLGAAAFSVALAGGGVAGALLGVPGTSGAQDGTTTTTVAASGSTANRAHPRPAVRRAARAVREGRADSLDAAAKVLGITPEALRTELQSGKSIADVATEKKVDVQKVIDAVVAAQKADLEAVIAKLPERVTEMVNHKGGGHRDGPPPAGAPAPPADPGAANS
jgi:hypothetical protein